jgi:2-polyprenyl-3-methyl-5-hydroxy-6-metoxy-1,4-benzoquinol methylase
MEINYFEHYAKMNGIDTNSTESFINWYENASVVYNSEIAGNVIDLLSRKVLDVGCGIGGFLYYLKQKGHKDFLGIDSDSKQIEICKKYVTENCKCIDIKSFIQKYDEKFDLIVMYDFIEHFYLDELIWLFNNISNILNPNGIIIFRTPNMSAFFGLKMRFMDITHKVGFTEWSLLQFLTQFNFTEIKIKNQAFSRKRKFVIDIMHKIMCNILFSQKPNVVTPNLIAFVKT